MKLTSCSYRTLAACTVFTFAAVSGAYAGDVIGNVVDVNGSGISAATVSLMRYETQYIVPQGTPMVFSAVTSETGQFDIASPPTGNYRLCVTGSGTAYLDSCEWFGARLVAVTGTAGTDVGQITLQAGALITITIQDPQNLIPHLDDLQLTTSAPEVIVGVVDINGKFHRVQPVWGNNSASFPVVVPPSMKLGLWVFSNELTIADSTGNAVQQDSTTMAQGAAPTATQNIDPSVTPTISLTVTGTK